MNTLDTIGGKTPRSIMVFFFLSEIPFFVFFSFYNLYLCLIVGHDFSLLRDPFADEDGADVRLHQRGVPHVTHPETCRFYFIAYKFANFHHCVMDYK